MARALIALLAGLVFGVGLAVSGMINPAKVLAFLDVGGIAIGAWDPSLALVMAAALAVTFLGYRSAWRHGRPLLAAAFSLPTRKNIDRRLVLGAALFGVGWGLVGYCPGPAIAALGQDGGETVVFVASMLIGMALHRAFAERRPKSPATSTGAGARSRSSAAGS